MGLQDDREDARANRQFRAAFKISLNILERKISKRLIEGEIYECLNDLETLGKLDALPSNFREYSVYGKRDVLLALSV